MKRKRLFLCTFAILIVMMIPFGRKKYEQWQEEHSGIPDAVSSMAIGGDLCLTVIANTSEIEDKEALAREIIHKCIDNSFTSIRLSTDINGYPASLKINVHLNRKDLEMRKEPVCKIEFETDASNESRNIKDNADEYHLFVDDEEVKFY